MAASIYSVHLQAQFTAASDADAKEVADALAGELRSGASADQLTEVAHGHVLRIERPLHTSGIVIE